MGHPFAIVPLVEALGSKGSSQFMNESVTKPVLDETVTTLQEIAIRIISYVLLSLEEYE